MTATDLQAYYAASGYFIMASVAPLRNGPLERNDWNEDDMCEHRWCVVGAATRGDLVEQNLRLGYTCEIDPVFRFFYRVVAMD